MEKEKETVKIKLNNGRIITLTITAATTSQLLGTDKFGKQTIVAIRDIYSMLPIEKKEG